FIMRTTPPPSSTLFPYTTLFRSPFCNTLQIHLMTEAHLGPVAFASLGLHPKVMDGIRQAGFTQCTPIQAQTLPIALAGRDVAGRSEEHTSELQSQSNLVCRLLLE